MKKLLALGKIEFIFTKRDITTFLLGIGIPVAFFFMITSMFTSQSGFTDNEMKVATKYFLISMTIYSSLSFALFSFPSMFQGDRSNNWYMFIKNSPIKMWQYYFVKIVRTLINFLFAIIIVFIVGNVFKGVEMTPKQWFISLLLILFGSFCMLSIGLLLSFINSQEKLSIIANIIYMILGMLGGLWWPLNQFPDYLQKVGKLMPTHHIREVVIQYISESSFAINSMLVLIGYAIIFIVITIIVKIKFEAK